MKAEHAMHTLIKMIKDDEDRQFCEKLLLQSINHWDSTEKK